VETAPRRVTSSVSVRGVAPVSGPVPPVSGPVRVGYEVAHRHRAAAAFARFRSRGDTRPERRTREIELVQS
jgi:hypothetical protein